MISKTYLRFTGFVFVLLCFAWPASAQLKIDEFDKMLNKAHAYRNIKSDSILYYAGIAYSIAAQMQQPDLQIDALKLIINTQIKKGVYASAIKNWLRADSIVTTNNLGKRQIEILMYKGLVFQGSGLNSESLKYFFDAKDLINKTGDDRFGADLDYYIALSYYDINELTKCRNFATSAIVDELNQRDSSFVLKSYLLISSSFNKADSIHKYLELAEESSKVRPDDYKYAILLNNKALFYKASGKTSKAKKAYLKAIGISLKNGYIKHLSNLYNNYAYLLMSEKKYDSALLVLDRALAFSRDINNTDIEASVLDSYSDYYAITGDPVNSLIFYRRSVKLRKEYTAKQQIEKSLFLSTVFETEKKEKEIARQESALYKTNAI